MKLKSKNYKLLGLITLFVAALSFSSCSEDDTPENSSYDTLLEELAAESSWYISYEGIDKTGWGYNDKDKYIRFHNLPSEKITESWMDRNAHKEGNYWYYSDKFGASGIIENTKNQLIIRGGDSNSYHTYKKDGNKITSTYEEGDYDPIGPLVMTKTDIDPETDLNVIH